MEVDSQAAMAVLQSTIDHNMQEMMEQVITQ